MPRNRTALGRRIWTLAILLGWAIATVAHPSLAQVRADATEIQRLQELLGSLGPAERLAAIRELREAQLHAVADSSDAWIEPDSSVDDRYAPHPWGVATDSVGAVAEAPRSQPVARFGDALFQQAPQTFAPLEFGPVPDDYRLGPGDEVVVEVWGEVSFRDRYVVDRDGAILLRDAGRAMVVGRTLAQAEADITRRLARVISGIAVDGGGSTFVNVSLGRLRTLRVFVVGEARRPGGYEVSSAATVFQALYAAAGPSELGSLRDVQLLRDDRLLTRLDLYEYLLQGMRSSDATLQDGDTVFIPVAKRTVTVRGEVRRPLRFELVEGEGLRDVVLMAGGLTAAARADLAHVERIVPFDRRVESEPVRVELDLPLDGLFDATRPVVPLQDGDVVHVLPINPREERYVSVAGSVTSPGRYGFETGMRVSDLLRRANGLWRDAFLDRAVLVRVEDDYSRSVSTITLSRLRAKSQEDRLLAPMDSLHVFSKEKMQDRQEVSLFGAVRRPGLYRFFEGMSLQDLVLAARGLDESADSSSAELSRLQVLPEGDSLAVRLEVALGRQASEASAVPLKNHDNVFIRKRVGFELQRNVMVEGEVARPGRYTLLSRHERVSDLIGRAGGLLESAYPPGLRLIRRGVGNIGLDLADAIAHPRGPHDILLQADDVLEVPPVPSSVTVQGAVGHPTSVVFRQGKGIGYYVARAGGYAQGADKGRARVVLPNGIARQVRRFWPDPEVMPGSTIEVPAKQHTSGIDWGTVIVRTSQVAAAVATIFIATN